MRTSSSVIVRAGMAALLSAALLAPPSVPDTHAAAVAAAGKAQEDQPSSEAPAVESPAAQPSPGRVAVVQGTGSCLTVREEPSVDARIVDCLPEGNEVFLTDAVQDDEQFRWRRIVDGGWVVTDFLQRTRYVVAGTQSCLNVREMPSTSAPIVGCVPDGTSVAVAEGPVTEEGVDWIRIEQSPLLEESGWVLAEFLD
jgi:hypothetical protein